METLRNALWTCVVLCALCAALAMSDALGGWGGVAQLGFWLFGAAALGLGILLRAHRRGLEDAHEERRSAGSGRSSGTAAGSQNPE